VSGTRPPAAARTSQGHDAKAALASAAAYLLDALDEGDRAELIGKFYSRDELEAAIVDRAQRVIEGLADSDEPVSPDERLRLVASVLTWGWTAHGVHERTDHATEAFLRRRRWTEVPPEVLARVSMRDRRLLPLLGRTVTLRAAVERQRPDVEPSIFLVPVVSTVLLGRKLALAAAGADDLPPDGDELSAEPGDLAPGAEELAPIPPEALRSCVTDVLQVLDRSAELIRAYYDSDRPSPSEALVHGERVLGNADFLLDAAALRLALDQRLTDLRLADPLDALEGELRRLAHLLRSTMRTSSRGVDEPDLVRLLPALAKHLGEAATPAAGSTAGAAVRSVHRHLTPWLRRVLLEKAGGPSMARVREALCRATQPMRPGDPQGLDIRLSEREHVHRWLLWGAFLVPEAEERDRVFDWLMGRRAIDEQDDLWLLVQCMHAVVIVLVRLPPRVPPAPAGLSPRRHDQLMRTLRAREREQCGPDRFAVVVDALPDLWTLRHPAVELIREVLSLEIGRDYRSVAKATLVAGSVVHGPAQGVNASRTAEPRDCCRGMLDGEPACATERGRSRLGDRICPAPDHRDVCPERPWPEVGYVESYATLARLAGYRSGDAARQQLTRYEGPGDWIIARQLPTDKPSDESPAETY
jgi:hypothetical protein